MNITCLGNICIDENTVEGSSYTNVGSPAIFFDLIFKKFPNLDYKIIAPYGKDFIPYKKDLAMYPSDPTFEKTLVYKNIVTNGKRIQYALNRDCDFEKLVIDDTMKEILEKTDVLIVAPLLPDLTTDFINKIMELMPKSSLKFLSPQGYFRNFDEDDRVIFRDFNESEEVLKLFDYCILSNEDYPNLFELSKVWTTNMDLGIIITQAENGASIVKNGEIINVPTQKQENLKDSTGAGDVFTASFIYNYFNSKDAEESVRFANKVAFNKLKFTTSELKSISLDELIK